MSIRNILIKIAYQNPDLRADILPIVKDIAKEAKVKTDPECMKKYKDKDGTFKGGKGEAFKNCVKAFEECATGVTDAEGLCAEIGRDAGKIKAAAEKNYEAAWDRAFMIAASKGERPYVAALFADAMCGDCGCGCDGKKKS